MLSTLEEIVWYTTIPLVALFAHRQYTYEFSTPKYAILTIATLIVGFYLLYRLFKNKEVKFFATPVHFTWLAFSIIALLSTINTFQDNRFFFRQAIDIGLYLFLNVLLSFYFSSIINKKEYIVRFLFIFVLTGLFIAINAILNFYLGYDILLGNVGAPFERASIKANIGNVIFVSNYLNMLLPIAIYFIASLDFGYLNIKRLWTMYLFKLVSLIAAILYFDVIVFSQTRSEYLALVIELILFILVYFFYLRKKEDKISEELKKKDPKALKRLISFRKVSILIFILMAIIIVVVYNVPTPFNNYASFKMTDRFNAMASISSRDERFLSWFSTIYIWKNHKILGQGIGTYQVYGLYGISDLIEAHPEYNYGWNNFKRAHNDYFQILAETGILGLGTIILMLFLLIIYVVKNIIKVEEKDDAILFSMLVLSGIIFAFQSVFSFPGHLLPNALLANFVISVGLGKYLNRVNGKEYTIKGAKAFGLAIILISATGLSTYLRWNHFISEVYFRNGNVAYATLSELRNNLSKIDEYLEKLDNIEFDLNNFTGQFQALSPQNWHNLKKTEAQRLNLQYNELQAESERQRNIENIRAQINAQRNNLINQKNLLPQQINVQYKIAKENLIKSVKLNHTYGKSYFYLAALAADPIRVNELNSLLKSDPESVLNQRADEYQNLIPEKFRYAYYSKLAGYIKNNSDLLNQVDLATIQGIIDSISLYELSLQTFTERNTFRTLAMRYNSLYKLNNFVLGKINDSELEKLLNSYSTEFFNKYGTWVRKTVHIMPGGWNRFPDWKNLNIELATMYGQDIYRFFAVLTVQTLNPINVESRDLLVDLAKKEIETCKYMELKGVWGVPDGVFDYLHVLAREYQTVGEYQESVYTYNQIVDWYKESYEYISKKISNTSYWEKTFNNFIESSKNELDKILVDDEKGYLSNSLTPIFVSQLNSAYREFTSLDFTKVEKDFIEALSKNPSVYWSGIGKKSTWKTITQLKMDDFSNQISALSFSEEAKKKIQNLMNKVVNFSGGLLYERYKRFVAHYDMVKSEFLNTVSGLLEKYNTASEKEIISDWGEIAFNSPKYEKKEDIIKYLTDILEKYK